MESIFGKLSPQGNPYPSPFPLKTSEFCKPKPKSILSLDIGSKRIGLAYCDPLCITSNILPAVKRFENNQRLKS